MDLRTIPGEAWGRLERRYPGAYMFLLSASLYGERKALRNERAFQVETPSAYTPQRIAWVKKRLEELERPELCLDRTAAEMGFDEPCEAASAAS